MPKIVRMNVTFLWKTMHTPVYTWKKNTNEVKRKFMFVAVQHQVIYCAFLFEMKEEENASTYYYHIWLCVQHLNMIFNYIINYIMRIICYLCTNYYHFICSFLGKRKKNTFSRHASIHWSTNQFNMLISFNKNIANNLWKNLCTTFDFVCIFPFTFSQWKNILFGKRNQWLFYYENP